VSRLELELKRLKGESSHLQRIISLHRSQERALEKELQTLKTPEKRLRKVDSRRISLPLTLAANSPFMQKRDGEESEELSALERVPQSYRFRHNVC